MRRRLFPGALALILLACPLAGLFGGGKQEGGPAPSPALPSPAGEPPAGEPVVVRGRVRLVGSALYSSLVLSDGEGRDWYLEGADRELLAHREQREVTARGLPEYRDIVLASGKKTGIQRFLRDVSLVE